MSAIHKAPAETSTATIGFEAKLLLDCGPVHEKQAVGARCGQAKLARRVRLRRQQPNQSNATSQRLAICGIEADREMSRDELRTPSHAVFTSSFEIHPSNFAPTLPGQLFYSTQIPVCLWFLAKNKAADAKCGFRDLNEVVKKLALAA